MVVGKPWQTLPSLNWRHSPKRRASGLARSPLGQFTSLLAQDASHREAQPLAPYLLGYPVPPIEELREALSAPAPTTQPGFSDFSATLQPFLAPAAPGTVPPPTPPENSPADAETDSLALPPALPTVQRQPLGTPEPLGKKAAEMAQQITRDRSPSPPPPPPAKLPVSPPPLQARVSPSLEERAPWRDRFANLPLADLPTSQSEPAPPENPQDASRSQTETSEDGPPPKPPTSAVDASSSLASDPGTEPQNDSAASPTSDANLIQPRFEPGQAAPTEPMDAAPPADIPTIAKKALPQEWQELEDPSQAEAPASDENVDSLDRALSAPPEAAANPDLEGSTTVAPSTPPRMEDQTSAQADALSYEIVGEPMDESDNGPADAAIAPRNAIAESANTETAEAFSAPGQEFSEVDDVPPVERRSRQPNSPILDAGNEPPSSSNRLEVQPRGQAQSPPIVPSDPHPKSIAQDSGTIQPLQRSTLDAHSGEDDAIASPEVPPEAESSTSHQILNPSADFAPDLPDTEASAPDTISPKATSSEVRPAPQTVNTDTTADTPKDVPPVPLPDPGQIPLLPSIQRYLSPSTFQPVQRSPRTPLAELDDYLVQPLSRSIQNFQPHAPSPLISPSPNPVVKHSSIALPNQAPLAPPRPTKVSKTPAPLPAQSALPMQLRSLESPIANEWETQFDLEAEGSPLQANNFSLDDRDPDSAIASEAEPETVANSRTDAEPTVDGTAIAEDAASAAITLTSDAVDAEADSEMLDHLAQWCYGEVRSQLRLSQEAQFGKSVAFSPGYPKPPSFKTTMARSGQNSPSLPLPPKLHQLTTLVRQQVESRLRQDWERFPEHRPMRF